MGSSGVTFIDLGWIGDNLGVTPIGEGVPRGVLGGRGGGWSQYLNQGESRRHSSKSNFTVMVVWGSWGEDPKNGVPQNLTKRGSQNGGEKGGRVNKGT